MITLKDYITESFATDNKVIKELTGNPKDAKDLFLGIVKVLAVWNRGEIGSYDNFMTNLKKLMKLASDTNLTSDSWRTIIHICTIPLNDPHISPKMQTPFNLILTELEVSEKEYLDARNYTLK